MTETISNKISSLCNLLSAMVLTAVAVGCAGSADEPVPDFPVRPEAFYSMGLYLELGDGVPAASRATPEGDYDSGTDFENYIHITDGNPDLRIYLLDTDDYVICEVASPEVMRLNNAPGRKTYELHFEVDSLFKSGYDLRPFKMLMLVNHRGRYPAVLPGISRLSDIVGAPYTIAEYSQAWPAQLNAESRIPMFGIVQFAGVALERDNMVVLPERLHLLRALSKVEVTDADVSEDKIIGVSVTRHNLRYAMSPSGVTHQDDYVKYSYNDDYVSTLTVPSGFETSDPMAFEKSSDGKFVTYLPEYRNVGRDENQRARIRVWYADGAHFDFDFKYFDSAPAGAAVGDIFDIRRNYYYRFSVNRRNVDADFEVDVLPYGEVVLKPGFGIDPENPD